MAPIKDRHRSPGEARHGWTSTVGRRSALVIFCALLALFPCNLRALCQAHLPVIRATAPLVDIREGGELRRGQWRISPQLRPDVYTTHRKNQMVSFITDVDSISCDVRPDQPFSFVILLNGTDSALTEVRYEPTAHFLTLQGGGGYRHEPVEARIPFVYDRADDPALVAIRTHFALDSIAGPGTDSTKVINILHWVHTSFPHNGSQDPPASNSLEDLMTKVITGHKAVDCGSLAKILNACYTSLGFRSRRIVCLPQDSTDVDCHSINSVFLPSHQAWVWMDPTNDAYVMDDHGRLLGISEVRQRLLDGLPLRLNEDANWNHRSAVTADGYLYSYMTKNLFALNYYYRTRGKEGAVQLLPVGYAGPIPRTRDASPTCTHDPDVFWGTGE